jgi:hypothetical protein
MVGPRDRVHLTVNRAADRRRQVSVPSVPRSLANALIAALTGTRIRQLPLSKTIKIY